MNAQDLQAKLEKRLMEMGRKTFLYKSFAVKILHYEIDHTECRVETTRQWIRHSLAEMLAVLEDEFLDTEMEVAEEETPAKALQKEINIALPKLKSLSVAETMSEAMLRAMDEVEHNSSFVDQAKTMTEIFKQGIAYVNTELEVFRTAQTTLKNR